MNRFDEINKHASSLFTPHCFAEMRINRFSSMVCIVFFVRNQRTKWDSARKSIKTKHPNNEFESSKIDLRAMELSLGLFLVKWLFCVSAHKETVLTVLKASINLSIITLWDPACFDIVCVWFMNICFENKDLEKKKKKTNERSNELRISHLNDLQRTNEIQMTSMTWLTKLKTTLIDRFCALKITTSFTGLNHLVLDFSFFFLLIEQLRPKHCHVCWFVCFFSPHLIDSMAYLENEAKYLVCK